MNVQEVISKIPVKDKLVVIAVSGFGGSGKSTLAKELKEKLAEVEIISMDEFIIDRLQKRTADWDSFDRPRLKEQVLDPARKNLPINYEVYDWTENKVIKNRTINPGTKYLIIEGCGIFHPDLMNYYDFTIWIDMPLELAAKRGMERDLLLGANHNELWLKTWMPNDQDFFKKYQPDKTAWIVFQAD